MKKTNSHKEDKLFQALIVLGKITIEKTIKHRDKGKLMTIEYQHLPVANIDYSLETYNYDWDKIEYFNRYEWYSNDFVNFIEKELKTLHEFKEAAKQVIKVFEIEKDKELYVENIGIPSFLRLIMKESPNRKITNKNLSYYANLFINDYVALRDDTPIVWNVNLWFENIFIESDEIEIEQGVYLRRLTKEQLADIRPKPNHIGEFEKITESVDSSSKCIFYAINS